jgi:hypothetical protein
VATQAAGISLSWSAAIPRAILFCSPAHIGSHERGKTRSGVVEAVLVEAFFHARPSPLHGGEEDPNGSRMGPMSS